jgi:hypothetical protein
VFPKEVVAQPLISKLQTTWSHSWRPNC